VALAAALPLLVWWLGWYPGFLSATSVAQLAAIDAGEFTNEIPALHGIVVWALSLGGGAPGIVTFLQAAAFVGLGALVAGRLTRLGAPWPAAAAVPFLLAMMPSVAATVVSLEVQVFQGLAAMWLFAELAVLAESGPSAFDDRGFSIRVGSALGLAWLLDHGGVVVVAVVAGAVLWVAHRDLRRLALAAGTALGVFVASQMILFSAFGVDREVPPLGLAYAPEVAAAYHHDPSSFGAGDIALLEAVAPLEVWTDAYRCDEGAALVGDRQFDGSVIRRSPGAYRGLVVRTGLSSAATVVGHRACAARFLFLPSPRAGERYQTYSYNVPPNTLGLTRDSLWEGGFNMTKALLVRTDQPDKLWLWWRPGLAVWPALALLGVAAVRARRLLWPMAVFVAFLAMAVLTVRTSSFREAFPVFVLASLSLPLWWPAVSAGARSSGSRRHR
jgi:hypothetical protein